MNGFWRASEYKKERKRTKPNQRERKRENLCKTMKDRKRKNKKWEREPIACALFRHVSFGIAHSLYWYFISLLLLLWLLFLLSYSNLPCPAMKWRRCTRRSKQPILWFYIGNFSLKIVSLGICARVFSKHTCLYII